MLRAEHKSISQTLVWGLLAALLLASLSGCGWRLRGSQMSAIDAVVLVQNKGGSLDLQRELEQGLKSSQVSLTSDPAAAELVLVLFSDSEGRRVLSVDQAGAASEFELQYQVTYAVRDGQGKVLLDRDTIRVQRDYRYDQTEVLAKAKEERMLFDFMRRAAVQKLLRQLQRAGESSLSTSVPADSHAN